MEKNYGKVYEFVVKFCCSGKGYGKKEQGIHVLIETNIYGMTSDLGYFPSK
jgi:hypothetical protein